MMGGNWVRTGAAANSEGARDGEDRVDLRLVDEEEPAREATLDAARVDHDDVRQTADRLPIHTSSTLA